MDSFLDAAHQAITSDIQKPWIIVTGNEACDLDSTVCALAYGYYQYHKLQTEATVIPFCNIHRSDMVLRPEIVHWLNYCQLDWTKLVFLDDLFGPKSKLKQQQQQSNNVSLILVDHHTPTGRLAQQSDWPVVEIIDHHKVETELAQNLKVKQIQMVGSCASLVTLTILQSVDGSHLPGQLWKLLYGAILLDTLGLSDVGREAGRLTDLDFRMANRIEDLIFPVLFIHDDSSRDTLFHQLVESKFNIQGISTWDLLRRDMKLALSGPDDPKRIVCSTISGHDFETLVCLPDFAEAAQRLCREQASEFLVCITVGYPSSEQPSESGFNRRYGIVLYASNPTNKSYKQLVSFLCDPANQLNLSPVTLPDCAYFTGAIRTKSVTRKQILPVLVKFIKQQQQPPKDANPTDQHTDVKPIDQNSSNLESSSNQTELEFNLGSNFPSSLSSSSPPATPTPNQSQPKPGDRVETRDSECNDSSTTKGPDTARKVWNDLVISFRNWLIPLRPKERRKFLRICHLASTNAHPDISTELLECLWTSLLREQDNNASNIDKNKCGSTDATTVATQTSVSNSEGGGGSGGGEKSQQNRRGGSVIRPTKEGMLATEPITIRRRYTLSDAKLLSSSWLTSDRTRVKFELPHPRFVVQRSDINSCIPDPETDKPSWLETEYLERNPGRMSSQPTFTSIDSAEAVCYRLYRRLSSMAFSNDGWTKKSVASFDGFEPDTELGDDELALLSTSLKNLDSTCLHKQTSTSGLTNHCSWPSGSHDHIIKRGLSWIQQFPHKTATTNIMPCDADIQVVETRTNSNSRDRRTCISTPNPVTFTIGSSMDQSPTFPSNQVEILILYEREISFGQGIPTSLYICASAQSRMQRIRALQLFKKLHRTCDSVFRGDIERLQSVKTKINEEFRQNASEQDQNKIEELLKYGEDVEMLLRTTVIQMEYKEDTGHYKLNLRDGLAYQDNDGCRK